MRRQAGQARKSGHWKHSFSLRVSRRIGAFVSKPLAPLRWALIALTFSGSYLNCADTSLLPRSSCVRTVCHCFSLCSLLMLMMDFNFLGSSPAAVRVLCLLNNFFAFSPGKGSMGRTHSRGLQPRFMWGSGDLTTSHWASLWCSGLSRSFSCWLWETKGVQHHLCT